MKERLLIKHGVGGRTFVDSDRDPVVYQIDSVGDQFVISTSVNDSAVIQEILRFRHELNVFLFRELDGGTVEKNWYYTGDVMVTFNLTKQPSA